MLLGPGQSWYTIQMSHQYLVELLFVSFAAYLALLLVALSVHKLSFWVGLDTCGCPVICSMIVPLKQPVPVNTSLQSLCIFFVNILLASLSAFLFVLDWKIIRYVCTIIGDACIAGTACVSSVLWGIGCLSSLWFKFSASLLLVQHLTHYPQ